MRRRRYGMIPAWRPVSVGMARTGPSTTSCGSRSIAADSSILAEHVHTVMIIPPRYAVSDVVGRLKQQTASQLRKKFPWMGRVYWKETSVWSPGYFVSTVGIEEAKIRRYVEWQGRRDSGQLKLEF